MRRTIPFSLALLAAHTIAQTTNNLPSCAYTCILSTPTGSCSSTDYKCLCQDTNYSNLLKTCVQKGCDEDDRKTTFEYTIEVCKAYGVTVTEATATATGGTPTGAASGTANAATTTAESSSLATEASNPEALGGGKTKKSKKKGLGTAGVAGLAVGVTILVIALLVGGAFVLWRRHRNKKPSTGVGVAPAVAGGEQGSSPQQPPLVDETYKYPAVAQTPVGQQWTSPPQQQQPYQQNGPPDPQSWTPSPPPQYPEMAGTGTKQPYVSPPQQYPELAGNGVQQPYIAPQQQQQHPELAGPGVHRGHELPDQSVNVHELGEDHRRQY